MDKTDYRNCKSGKYHDMKVLTSPFEITGASIRRGDVQVEVCRYCKERKEYKFDDQGRMADDRQYFLDHIRAFAQPSMSCYYDIYPNAALEFAEEARTKKKSEEYQAAKTEKFTNEIKDILK